MREMIIMGLGGVTAFVLGAQAMRTYHATGQPMNAWMLLWLLVPVFLLQVEAEPMTRIVLFGVPGMSGLLIFWLLPFLRRKTK